MKKIRNITNWHFIQLATIVFLSLFAGCNSDDETPFKKSEIDVEFYPYQESNSLTVKAYDASSDNSEQSLSILNKVMSRITITVNDIPLSEKLIKVTCIAQKEEDTPFSLKGKVMINAPEGDANFAEVISDDQERTNYLSAVVVNPQLVSSQTVFIDLFPVNVVDYKLTFIATTKLADNTTRAYRVDAPANVIQNFEQGRESTFAISLSNVNVELTRFAQLSSVGLNKGYGIEIYGGIYSPVNSGYDSDHPYGLLYQFGRKDGQGYDAEINVPTVVDGPLDFSQTSPVVDPSFFYVDKRADKNEDDNWRQPVVHSWPSADIPAPSGWTLPSYIEGMFFEYSYNFPTVLYTQNTPHDISGYWIGYNADKATANDPNGCLFFPTSGFRNEIGVAHDRGKMTIFWMNGVNPANNRGWLQFFGSSDYLKRGYCAIGASVRCKLK